MIKSHIPELLITHDDNDFLTCLRERLQPVSSGQFSILCLECTNHIRIRMKINLPPLNESDVKILRYFLQYKSRLNDLISFMPHWGKEVCDQIEKAQKSGAFERIEWWWNGANDKINDIFVFGVNQGRYYFLASCNKVGAPAKTVSDVQDEVRKKVVSKNILWLHEIVSFVGVSAIILVFLSVVVDTWVLYGIFLQNKLTSQDIYTWLMLFFTLCILINIANREFKRKKNNYDSVLNIVKSCSSSTSDVGSAHS